MLYQLFKFLFKPTLDAYFRSIVVENAARIPSSGPVLLAVNHNSAFMDPILVAVKTKRVYHFLARGEAFSSPVARWFYARLNMLPIYRPETMPDDVHKNKEVFKKCHEALAKGKAIMVFPEGFSKTERRLRPIKSGLSRIALGAEKENDFFLDVKIVPVGINYSNPHLFRSDVYLNIGEVIHAKDYRKTYEEDRKKAYDQLTDDVRKAMEEVTVVIGDERMDDFVEDLEFLAENTLSEQGSGKFKLDRKKFELSREMIDGINKLAKNNREKYLQIEGMLTNFTSRLKRFRIDLGAGSKGSQLSSFTLKVMLLILGLPIFAFGLIANVFPLWVTSIIAKSIQVREDFIGSLKITAGMFVFLLVYLFQYFLLSNYTGSLYALGIVLSFYPALIFAIKYRGFYSDTLLEYRQDLLFKKKASAIELLKEQRQFIVEEIKDHMGIDLS